MTIAMLLFSMEAYPLPSEHPECFRYILQLLRSINVLRLIDNNPRPRDQLSRLVRTVYARLPL